MGLAGPRQRNKIGADPNNTSWSKSTDRFGHKILSAQGWKPGDTLGAENASHSSHYTSASSSHIRVLLREDGLGLGAKNGRQDADRFGLDMFQGLLGRLNGKSESELEKEAGCRRDMVLKEVVVKRFGGTTFVSGGYLLGDKISKDVPENSENLNASDVVAVKEKKSKKRKRAEAENDKEVAIADSSAEEVALKKARRKDRKERKQKQIEAKQPQEIEYVEQVEKEAPAEEQATAELTEKETRRQQKAERRAAKEARRQEKAERKRKKREDQLMDEAAASSISTTPMDTSEVEVATDTSTSLQRTAPIPRGRFAIRARYSQQKRLAASDQKALQEIFMIKAGA